MNTTWLYGSAIAVLAVLSCAWGAAGQGPKADVNQGENLQEAINAAGEGETLILEAGEAYAGPVTINKALTFEGEDGFLAHEVMIEGGVTVDDDATVEFNGIGFSEGGSEAEPGMAPAALMVMGGSSVNLERCYIIGSETGVSLTGTGSASFDSCSFPDNGTGILLQSGGSARIMQCTFFDNGTAVDIRGGSANVVACLFDGNTVAVSSATASAGELTGNVLSNDDDLGSALDNVTQTGGLSQANVARASDDDEWVGKLLSPVPSTVSADDLGVIAPSGLDFELQPRGQTGVLQAGADELGAAAGLVWIDCDIVTPFTAQVGLPAVGRNTAARIVVRLGPAAPQGQRRLYIKPQYGSLTGNDFIPLELTAESSLSSRLLTANFTPPATEINGEPLDGLATVYLVIDGEIYGIGENEPLVSAVAKANSTFLIDTVPPRISVPAGGATAGNFIFSSNDPDMIPVSQGTIGGSGSSIDPKAFFNTQGDLSFSVTATFVDEAPELDITPSGLAPLNGGNNYSLTVDQVVFPDGDPVPITAPFWDRGFTGYGTYLLGSDLASVSYVPGLGALAVTWTFDNIPVERASANDWHIAPRFNCMDLAGNLAQSDDREPVHFWWMLSAGARLTNFSYDGSVALDPIFSWDLVRLGQSPGRSEPAVPMAYYRVWSNTDSENPESGTWVEAHPGWIGPDPRSSFEVDPSLLTGDGLFMIAVRGVDEAGNDQLSSGSALHQALGMPNFNPINFDAGNINGETLALARQNFYLPFIDTWRTPVAGQGDIETAAIPQFWHNYLDDGGNFNNQIDAAEPSFGASRVIPFPEDPANARVEMKLLIQMAGPPTAVFGYTWEIYRNGSLYLESDPDLAPILSSANPDPLILPLEVIPENIVQPADDDDVRDHAFGDPNQTENFTVRVVGYNLGGGVLVADPTPVTIQFRVVPQSQLEEETGGIQPFKTFTRE